MVPPLARDQDLIPAESSIKQCVLAVSVDRWPRLLARNLSRHIFQKLPIPYCRLKHASGTSERAEAVGVSTARKFQGSMYGVAASIVRPKVASSRWLIVTGMGSSLGSFPKCNDFKHRLWLQERSQTRTSSPKSMSKIFSGSEGYHAVAVRSVTSESSVGIKPKLCAQNESNGASIETLSWVSEHYRKSNVRFDSWICLHNSNTCHRAPSVFRG